jgi:hypothetical protein
MFKKIMLPMALMEKMVFVMLMTLTRPKLISGGWGGEIIVVADLGSPSYHYCFLSQNVCSAYSY